MLETALDERQIKRYYMDIERYDWVTDPRYPEKLFHGSRERGILKWITRYGRGMSILDVGCGTGLISRHLHGNYVLALDINEWAIRRAKLHSSNGTHFIVGDAENLPLASNSFDVVIFTDVLEHLLTPERTLEGILRVMKPGAILVGEIPSRSVVWKFRKYLTSTCPVTEPFHHNFSMNDLRLLLNDFRIIKMCRGAFGLELVFVAQKPT